MAILGMCFRVYHQQRPVGGQDVLLRRRLRWLVGLEDTANQGRNREAGMRWRLTARAAGDILLSNIWELRMEQRLPVRGTTEFEMRSNSRFGLHAQRRDRSDVLGIQIARQLPPFHSTSTTTSILLVLLDTQRP